MSSAEELCSKCENIVSFGPVWLNMNGQNICGRCKVPQGENYIRNLVYEALLNIDAYNFPCKNENYGCEVKNISELMKDHEDHCQFTPYECFMKIEGCGWNGLLTEIEQHFDEKHKGDIIQNSLTKKPDIKNDEFEKRYLLKFNGFLFLIRQKFDVIKEELTHNVALIYREDIAELFRHKLMFYVGNDKITKNTQIQLYQPNKMGQEYYIHNLVHNLEEGLGKYEQLDFDLRYSITNF